MSHQKGFSFVEKMHVVSAVGILIVIFLTGCYREASIEPEKVVVPMSGDNSGSRGEGNYGSRGNDTSWPEMPADAVAKSDNLLAKNYMFVLDASGSMAESSCTNLPTKMHEAKAAITAFGESLSADANLGLLAFSGMDIRAVLPISPYDRNRLQKALDSVQPSGSTPLADAMSEGFSALTKQAVSQLGNGQYNLVVVTDGVADRGQDVIGTVGRVVKTSPVMIHAVGFCIDSDHALNQAGLTRYVAASDGDSLRRGLEAVLAEAPAFDVSAFEALQ